MVVTLINVRKNEFVSLVQFWVLFLLGLGGCGGGDGDGGFDQRQRKRVVSLVQFWFILTLGLGGGGGDSEQRPEKNELSP